MIDNGGSVNDIFCKKKLPGQKVFGWCFLNYVWKDLDFVRVKLSFPLQIAQIKN